MKKFAKAFSMIELSIVILIVGIVIAGVTQSSRLVRAFKLSSARSLTQSSPVASISGLVLWLEPTMETSFVASEAEDETNLSAWYDINPQATVKNNFTKTASSVITYEDSSINNLPAVEFSGANGESLLGSAIINENNYYTLFAVSKQSSSTNNSAYRNIFNNGSGNGFTYLKVLSTGARQIVHQGINGLQSSQTFTLNNEISSITYSASGGGVLTKIYINGATTTVTNSTTGMSSPTTSSDIGSNWIGTISELIVFNRALKNSERNDVEAYLSKKYGIAVVVN